jgi:hypothetical protein
MLDLKEANTARRASLDAAYWLLWRAIAFRIAKDGRRSTAARRLPPTMWPQRRKCDFNIPIGLRPNMDGDADLVT